MSEKPKIVVYEGSGEWSALYLDGTLDTVGDHYLSHERIEKLLGVEHIYSDAFFRPGGGHGRDDVLQTLEEVQKNEDLLEEKRQLVKKMRNDAEAMIKEAKRIEDETR